MASAATQYGIGHEYDLGDGTTGVWNGKAMVSSEAYIAAKQGGTAAFGDGQALAQRLEAARAQITNHNDGWFGLGGNTGYLGKVEAGDGSFFKPGIAGTPGYNLDKTLLPIRSNTMIRNMQALKAASPTGATGMGSMSNAEGETLKSTDAALDIGQSKDQLLKELDTYKTALIRHSPGLHPSNPIQFGSMPPAEIPQGAYFTDAAGRVFTNKKGAGAPSSVMAPRVAPAPAPGGWSNFRSH